MEMGLPAGEPKALAAGTVPSRAARVAEGQLARRLNMAIAFIAVGFAIDFREIIPYRIRYRCPVCAEDRENFLVREFRCAQQRRDVGTGASPWVSLAAAA